MRNRNERKIMSIEVVKGKHGDRYKVRRRKPCGAWYTKTFRTKTEARNYDASEREARRTGAYIDVHNSSTPFSEVADQWLNQNPTKRQLTLDRERSILRIHILPEFVNRQISSIKKTDLQSLVNKWTADGLAPRTVQRHTAILKGIFKRAVDAEMILKSPAIGVKIPRPEAVVMNVLTEEDAKHLLDSVDHSMFVLMYMFLATGIRYSELAGLKVKDVSIFSKNPELRVERSLHNTSKGMKYESTKTSAGRRSFSLSPYQVKILASHITTMGKTIDDGEDPLFVSPKGKYLNYSNFRNRVFLPAVERAGLGKRTIQDIRRTVGTLLAQSELDMKSVATHMGHSEFRTTLKYYVAETVEGRQRVNCVIEGFLGTDLNDGSLEEAN